MGKIIILTFLACCSLGLALRDATQPNAAQVPPLVVFHETEQSGDRIKRSAVTLNKALDSLIERQSREVSALQVRKCLHDPYTCERYGVDGIRLRRDADKNQYSQSSFVSNCGKTLIIQPFDAVQVNMDIPTGALRCIIDIAVRDYFGRSYFLEFAPNHVQEFGDCDVHSFKIVQGHSKQIYCQGSYMFTEFPEQKEFATFIFESTDRNATLSLVVRSAYLKSPRSSYKEALPRIPFTRLYSAKGILISHAAALKTYDPKMATFQPCPLECGVKTGTYNKIPREDLAEVSGFVKDPVDEETVPWYVSVKVVYRAQMRRKPDFFGGSIINSRTVLTAANYLVLNQKSIAEVVVATRPFLTERSSRMPGQVVKVSKQVIHPGFFVRNVSSLDQQYHNDIAVLILESPLRLGFSSVPVCFGPPLDYWGNLVQTLRPVQFDGATYLTEAYGVLWRKEVVEEHINVTSVDEVLVHTYHDTFTTPENIGSPVMVNMRNDWYLIGVVSQSFTDPSFGNGTVARISTNVNYFMDFIDRILSKAPSKQALCY